MDKRTSKENYYLDIADAVLQRSTCLRRMYGAIIVRNDEIISTGYNGAPRGRINCTDAGRCARVETQIPSGERYELCRSVHAEANAIISASRRDMLGATLYLVGRDAQTHELLDKRHKLLDVPPPGHKRRHRARDHPHRRRHVQHRRCRRVGEKRRLRFLDRITKKTAEAVFFVAQPMDSDLYTNTTVEVIFSVRWVKIS